MTWLAMIATCVAALELAAVHRAWSDGGVYARAALRAPVVFGTAGTWVIVLAQLASGLALPWVPEASYVAFATTLAIAVRFRGTYNGGSDVMLLVVLTGMSISAAGHERIGMAYVTAQLVLSYVLAGVAKLRDADWRRATALPFFVRLPQYGVPPTLIDLVTRLAWPATISILVFEVGFPVAFVGRPVALVVLGIAVLFHLGNAIVFGLDRFLWSWLAAFPALLFWLNP